LLISIEIMKNSLILITDSGSYLDLFEFDFYSMDIHCTKE